VVVKRSYAHKDFDADYNSYRGNAYGLANTLMQTAYLKPSLKPGKLPVSRPLRPPPPNSARHLDCGFKRLRLDTEGRGCWAARTCTLRGSSRARGPGYRPRSSPARWWLT
jgi:hypothetical protein